MCGIAGRILGAPGKVGNDLVALMEAQEHRGADSTGFAVYGAPRDSGYVLRAMGFDRNRIDADLDDFRAVLRAHDADLLEDPSIVTDDARHYCVRMVISEPRDLARWIADADISPARTANPSMAELSAAGTSSAHATASTRTRPTHSPSGTVSCS